MSLFRRFIVPLALLLGFGFATATAEEIERIWTNKNGKTVKGVLKEKEDGWAKILIKSKIHKIKVSTLSEADQKYIEEAKVYRTLRMRVTTVRATSSKGAAGRDIRKVKVTLENVQGRKLKFRLIWIAQTQARKTYGAHRVIDVEYDADGEYFHQEIFYKRSENGAQYKGFAARLVDEGGATLAETASLQPFVRFLNETEQGE